MTVFELIHELNKCNPDAHVECEVEGEDSWYFSHRLSVEEDKDYPIVTISGTIY